MDAKEKSFAVNGRNIPISEMPVMKFLGRADVPTLFIDKFVFTNIHTKPKT